MKIEKTNITEAYTFGAGGARRESGGASAPKQAPSSEPARPRGDTVAFSADGLALAGSSELSPERLAEIRSRIESGFYNRPAVAEAVARKLIGRLDG